MQHGDVKDRLKDTINDHVNASGPKHKDDSYVDHDGDGTDGNVTYMCKGDMRQAPYEIGTSGGKAATSIDFGNSKNVIPQTTYVPEAEDSDHYTAMGEAMREAKLYTELPVYERFISKKKRDLLDSSDFAGKGRSFPIDTAADIPAALSSIPRAGPGNYSGDTIRANIKKIGKRKGLPLPDSLKDASDKESAPRGTWRPDGVLLVESSAMFVEQPRLKEAAATSYPIKLISPGRGSSGYYPAETLKKAAESKVFKAGTQMFWNHDTDAEESQRPEGDLNRLAAVTTTDAAWHENGHDGPGLYAQAKVFGDYADRVKEMGPHIGLSIRAGGDRDEAARAPDGKPRVITALRNAASVDFVTKAGRDGKVFTEGARPEGEEDMDLKEVQALIEARVAPVETENKKLREQLAMSKAPGIIKEALKDIRLPDASKNKIVKRIAESVDSATLADNKKLTEVVEAEALIERDFLAELGLPTVQSIGVRMTEKEIETQGKQHGEALTEAMSAMVDIFVGPKLPKSGDIDARERRKEARKAFINGRAA